MMKALKVRDTTFEELIMRRGRPVRWKEASICSCHHPTSGQPSYVCQACNGIGYIYQSSYDGIALVQSLLLHKEHESVGIFELGDAIMTVPRHYLSLRPDGKYDKNTQIPNPMFDIGMFDLVTLLDDEYKSSELLIKGESVSGRTPDTLLNEDITRIKYVYKSDPTTGTVTEYNQDEDFQLVGNQIEWIGNQPEDGETYSVTYYHLPTYIVHVELPRQRHQDKRDQPKRVVIRYRTVGSYEGE